MINKIYIYGNDQHALDVYAAFVEAIEDNGGSYSGTVVYGTDSIAAAVVAGCQMYIKSFTGMTGMIASALANYPSILTIMPAGSNTPNNRVYNSGGNMPVIVVTGAGDDLNETGYDVEFYSNDPITPEATPDEQDLSSYSNGYIAGQLAYIVNTLECSLWEARFRAQVTATREEAGRVTYNWEPKNGYGKINVTAAIAYVGIIPSDPYLPQTDEELQELNEQLQDANNQLTIDNAALLEENTRLAEYDFTTNVIGIKEVNDTKHGEATAISFGKVEIIDNAVSVIVNKFIDEESLTKEPLDYEKKNLTIPYLKDYIYSQYCKANSIDESNLIINEGE